MTAKVRSPEGKALYARRKSIVEPVFGQIKEARGFRRFLLRGLEHIRGEWRLVCLTHNLLKIWRYGQCSERGPSRVATPLWASYGPAQSVVTLRSHQSVAETR